jgi:hypothetical protein
LTSNDKKEDSSLTRVMKQSEDIVKNHGYEIPVIVDANKDDDTVSVMTTPVGIISTKPPNSYNTVKENNKQNKLLQYIKKNNVKEGDIFDMKKLTDKDKKALSTGVISPHSITMDTFKDGQLDIILKIYGEKNISNLKVNDKFQKDFNSYFFYK